MALDLLVEHGLIKTRQHGVIVTEAGTEATYAVGGTLNIRVATGLGASDIREIPYGLSVTVKPIVDVDNRVKLNVDATYSELDYANAVDSVPALRNSNIKGVVNMQEGQSVLLSGITSNQVSSSEQGWWLLSKIPILGWLFKSRDYLGQRLDNALFVTPRIYEPGGKVHKTLVRGVYDSMLKNGVEPTDLPELSDAPATSSRNTGGGSEGGGFEE
jgi:pilus assembly protein CpaC